MREFPSRMATDGTLRLFHHSRTALFLIGRALGELPMFPAGSNAKEVTVPCVEDRTEVEAVCPLMNLRWNFCVGALLDGMKMRAN